MIAEEAARRAVADLPLAGDLDLVGLAYERFFPDLFKGLRGQFFTPRPLVRLLLARLGDLRGLDVLDPTCGSGGLLVSAHRAGASVRGIDVDPLLVELARLNLRLAGVSEPRVRQEDFFRAVPEPADLVIANPPFSVDVDDPAVLADSALGRGRRRVSSDALFAEHLPRWVRPGGRAAIVLPWSVITNPTAEPVRALVEGAFHREAVCALPEGVFRPFGGAAGRACLLWLRRKANPSEPAPGPTAWARVADPGYDVRSQSLKSTPGADLEALARGVGWSALPDGCWAPPQGDPTDGVPVAALARARGAMIAPARLRPPRRVAAIDLADTDKSTGEVCRLQVLESSGIPGARVVVHPGDLLVSRLRPELGNVAVAPAAGSTPMVGSGEWIVLEAGDHAHGLLHALRTPRWRASLPVTGGQTRPRTSVDAVLRSQVRWPSERVVRGIDTLSRRLHGVRAALRSQLEELQAAVDAFAEGALGEEELEQRVEALSAAFRDVVGDPDGPPR